MAKRPPKSAEPPAESVATTSPVRPLVAITGTLLLAAAGYFLLAWLGQAAGDAVAHREAYRMRFDDLNIAPPPGLDRETFLTEVRYLGNAPREFSTKDAAMRVTLAAAFSKHPWVQSAVPVDRGALPVTLTYREPVLMVMIADGPERLVDAKGVLLPRTSWPTPLPKLLTPQPPPLSPAGELWLNPRLPRALEFVKDYGAWELRHTDTAWSFTRRDGKPYTLPLNVHP